MKHRYRLVLGLLASLTAASCTAAGRTRIEVGDSRLYLLGTFDEHTEARVLQHLDRHPEIDTLVFTANGGSIHDASTLSLGREIRRRRLNTHLIRGGVVASGGLSLFLAGVERSTGPGAMIGVHSWQHCWGDDAGRQQCRDGRDHPRDDSGHALHMTYIEELLGTAGFYWHSIDAAASDSIHWLTGAEIAAFGIATIATTDVAQPFGPRFEREKNRYAANAKHPPPRRMRRSTRTRARRMRQATATAATRKSAERRRSAASSVGRLASTEPHPPSLVPRAADANAQTNAQTWTPTPTQTCKLRAQTWTDQRRWRPRLRLQCAFSAPGHAIERTCRRCLQFACEPRVALAYGSI